MKTHLAKIVKGLQLKLALAGVVLFGPWLLRSTLADVPQGTTASAANTSLSVRALDLTRVPTTEELIAAGQLGGLLYPTHELPDTNRAAKARLDFGRAIEEWNQHSYTNAVVLFRQHVLAFPDSPWAAEALLHVGCDATYNGRYAEAETIFAQIISQYQGNTNVGAILMSNKARQRLALVKVEENNLAEANQLFLDLKQNSPDWKHRTYAAHWLQRISRFTAAKESLLNCGADALAYVFQQAGQPKTAALVQTRTPGSLRGHSISDLVKLAAAQGYEMQALHVDAADLERLPLPAIVHIAQGQSGDKGHYWVLDKVKGKRVELFDPQSKRRFHQTTDELAAQWKGDVLVHPAGGQLPGRKMDSAEMDEALGGCCGAPRAPDNNGDPGRNGAGPNGNPCGAPKWSVDMISMNLFVTDTPMWYDPPVGPPVRISVSYSSQSSIEQYQPFGNKWTFSYGGYLIMDTSGAIIVFMPDGRSDVYTPNGTGGFVPPYRVHNTLTQIGANHFQLQTPDGSVYVYQIPAGTSSQQPFLTEIDDPYGQKLTFGYNAAVQLSTITDAQGKVFSLSYSGSGLVTNVADPFGRNASFQYDGNKNLVQITDMGGYTSTLSYDTNVFVTSLGDQRGTTYFYTEVPGPAGANSDNYPPPGDPNMFQNYRITVTNPAGGKEEYMYYGGCDQDGYNGCAGYSWHVSPRDYIPWQSQSVNNYRSRVPKTRYIPVHLASGQRGEIGQIIYPEGDYVQYTYDPVTGDRLSATDRHGYAWHYTYNSVGMPLTATDARGTTTTFTYAANGFDLLATSNALGQISFNYNPQHSILSFSDHLTNTASFVYNTLGQTLYQVDALGLTNQYSYDANNRLSAVYRAGQLQLAFKYDPLGRLQTAMDATGFAVTNAYDNLNRIVQVNYPDAKSQSYVYSACCPHLLDSVTDRGGHTVLFTYDVLKRLVQTQNPEGGLIQVGYDANGNTTSVTDPNGNLTTLTYDSDNRLVRKAYADGRGYSLAYDQGGFLSARTNANGVITYYTYDQNRNLLSTSYSDDTPGVTNSYDAFNRLVTSVDALGTNTFSYDAGSRLLNAMGPWPNEAVAYSYDSLNRRTNLTLTGNQPVGYSFDALNRLTAVNVGSGNYGFGYSGASPLVQNLTRPNGSFTTYQYDGLNRLTRLVNNNSGAQPINAFAYAYNPQDLRGSESVSNAVIVSPSANQLVTNNFNGLNQLLTSSQSNRVFTYDAEGNLTRGYTAVGALFTAAYDAENRLKNISYTNAGTVFSNQYIYNGSGLLAQLKEFQNGSLVADTRFVRSGYLIVQERGGNNAVTRGYTWGLSAGGGIGGLLDLTQSGQSYSYLYDGKGNVAAVLDAGQTTVASYAYDPFGVLLASAGTLNQPFQFSTRRYDANSGLVEFGFRQYSPLLGRWLNRDPLGGNVGGNLYGYVGNNPVNYLDPFGLYSIGQFLGDVGTGLVGLGIGIGAVALLPEEAVGVLAVAGAYGLYSAAQTFFNPCTSSDQRISIAVQLGTGLLGGELVSGLMAGAAGEGAPIVIGENMARVNAYADSVGGETIDSWLAGRDWSQALNDEFIAQMQAEGRDFIDIGPDFGRRLDNNIDPSMGRPPSSVYGGERQQLQNYDNYQGVYQRTGKYQGGVPGFDF